MSETFEECDSCIDKIYCAKINECLIDCDDNDFNIHLVKRLQAQLEKAEKIIIREQSRHDRIESGVITNEMAMTQFKVDVEEYFQDKEQGDE